MSATFREPMRQAGFSIVTAIFLLVVLAALGAFIVTVSGVQHTTSALDVQGARAYQASRAGIEWGLHQVLRPVAAPACFGPTTLTFPTGSILDGFTTTVQCTRSTATEGASTVDVYRIVSTAASGAGANRVEREIEVTTGRGG